QGERPRTLASLADSIRAFSDNISTVRVPQIITGKERGSAGDVLSKIVQSEAEVRTHFMPLFPILEQLKAKLQVITANSLFSSHGHQAMLELAKLYASYERYPEAAIVLREGWISLYAETQGGDEQQLKPDVRNNMESRWNAAEGKDSPERIADQIRNVRNDIQHGGFKEKDARNPATSLIRDLHGLIKKFEAKVNQ
ncbi:MAG TPA: TM1812 family CRISPR-associated protein, partial [Thiolinea sp.]|nr:TM1812 family CRISPR-associated protein [Thiolinea sp.]